MTLSKFSLSKRQLLPLTLVLLAGVGIAGWTLSGKGKDKAEAATDGAKPVQVQTVKLAPLAQPKLLVGTIRARVESDHGFRVAGKIAERKVQTGDRVKAGAVLAALDATDFRLTREQAEAELAAARSSARQAELELSRITDLRTKGWSTDQALDRQKATYDEAVGRVRRAERQVELAANSQSYAELRAETDGIIISVLAEAGQVVGAGQAIVRIARDGDREAQIAVPEQDLAFAREAKAEAVLWSEPGKSYQANLRELSPNADPATRTFQARYTIAGLAPDSPLGMTATLTLARDRGGKVARIPLAAVMNEGNGTEVYVFDAGSGELRRKAVKVATYEARQAIVTEGLAEGDVIVTLGTHALRVGQKVRPLPEAKQG